MINGANLLFNEIKLKDLAIISKKSKFVTIRTVKTDQSLYFYSKTSVEMY